MKKSLLSIVLLIVLSIVFYPQKELISKINGSPGGKTGSPADGGSCIQCHDDFALNSGVGIPNITSNIPSTGYVPGVTYTITSSISEAGLEIINTNGKKLTEKSFEHKKYLESNKLEEIEGSLDDAFYSLPEYNANTDSRTYIDSARDELYTLKEDLEEVKREIELNV